LRIPPSKRSIDRPGARAVNHTLVGSAPPGTGAIAPGGGTSPPGTASPDASAGRRSAEEVAAATAKRAAVPPWVISLIGHLLVLASLWPIHFAATLFNEPVVTASVVDEETVSTIPQDLRFDTAAAPEIGNGGDNTSEIGLRSAPLGAAMETPKAPVVNVASSVSAIGTKQVVIGRPVADVGIATRNRELSDLVETTGSSEHTGGVRGAIDRLTVEIEASLRQENTLVVWLFDATPSMKSRRDEIADRFENVYRQLGLLGVGGNGALTTAVATFSKTTHYLTKKPVADVGTIQKAIRKIEDEDDDKGHAVENVFAAAVSAGERFRNFRLGSKDRRRVMIVIVTDERGSDFRKVEDAIVKLRRLGMRVYCVGDDAVFGRVEHHIPYVYPDGFRGYGYTERGPETPELENVDLPFWGGGRQLEEMTSGFGPYSLSRLCAETGGLFLISEELPGPKFDPAILRNYSPDYRPIKDYVAERARNGAKEALFEAAKISCDEKHGVRKEMPRPQLVFRADNDNTLRQQITEAQKPLAELDYRLNEMHTLLETGERDRSRLDTPRWRASFDLSMGRVLAMRARALGYNLMLAEMKVSPRPFQDATSNTWRIEPASEEKSPPKIQKFAKRAREYLQGVIEEHRGTQWEALAKEELKSPMGWDWHESRVNYPPPAPPRMPRRIQLDDERERNMPRQPPMSHDPPKL
jgi:hypothetical protein